MGFDERSRILSGELHYQQGAYYPILSDSLLETSDVLVECVKMSHTCCRIPDRNCVPSQLSRMPHGLQDAGNVCNRSLTGSQDLLTGSLTSKAAKPSPDKKSNAFFIPPKFAFSLKLNNLAYPRLAFVYEHSAIIPKNCFSKSPFFDFL